MGKTPSMSVLYFDAKQSDGDAPVIMKLWEMWSTLSLPLLVVPHCPGVMASFKVLSMSQMELFDI